MSEARVSGSRVRYLSYDFSPLCIYFISSCGVSSGIHRSFQLATVSLSVIQFGSQAGRT